MTSLKLAALTAACASALLLTACAQENSPAPAKPTPEQEAPQVAAPAAEPAPPAAVQRNLYWGDTHLHTSYSPDAFLMQNRSATPDTAYQYAKGAPVVHPLHRARVQIETPLGMPCGGLLVRVLLGFDRSGGHVAPAFPHLLQLSLRQAIGVVAPERSRPSPPQSW